MEGPSNTFAERRVRWTGEEEQLDCGYTWDVEVMCAEEVVVDGPVLEESPVHVEESKTYTGEE